MRQAMRHALRQLRRNPEFAVVRYIRPKFTWAKGFDSTPISETKLPCSSCMPPGGASRPRVPEFGRSFEIPIASIGQDRPSLQCGNSRDPWVWGSGNRVLAAVPADLKTARPNRYIPVVPALAAPE